MMKKAVALGYDPELDIAPRVLAKGEGKLAEKIIAIAKEESIPLYSSPDLVASLLKIDLIQHARSFTSSSPGVGLGLPA